MQRKRDLKVYVQIDLRYNHKRFATVSAVFIDNSRSSLPALLPRRGLLCRASKYIVFVRPVSVCLSVCLSRSIHHLAHHPSIWLLILHLALHPSESASAIQPNVTELRMMSVEGDELSRLPAGGVVSVRDSSRVYLTGTGAGWMMSCPLRGRSALQV